MDGADDIHLIEFPDSTEEIPTLDISAYLAGEPGARERTGAELRHISETVGFFYLKGHGVPESTVDGMFAESKRLHNQPLEKRRGYQQSQYASYRTLGYQTAESQLERKTRPGEQPSDLRSRFIMHREREPGDSRTVEGDHFRTPNYWPQDLPGFRETAVSYYAAIEDLCLRMMPLWAAALGLPSDFFDRLVDDPYISLALPYYPPQKVVGNRQFGSSPHTDNCLMTILAQHQVPGLAVRMPSGHWRVADVVPGTFVVNTGNMLVRWTNERFLSTKHRVINTAEVGRYSIPVFFGPNLDAVIECLPSCQSADHPAKYPPIRYEDLMLWYFDKGVVTRASAPEEKDAAPWVPADGPYYRPASP